MTAKTFVLLCIYLISFSGIGFAQETSGNLEGRVTDTTGTPLSGVNIAIQSESLQGIRGTITNDDGYFRMFSLPAGDYIVRISIVGYRDVVIEDVQISLGKTNNLGEVKLEPHTINLPEVTVSGEKQIIDPTSTNYGGNLSSKDFSQLPIDRNYKNIVTLLPYANASYYGDEANIGGGTGFENKYFVDGAEVTDPLFGASGTNLPYNFIQEVELKSGGYDVSARSSLGGLINVVTKSGTNDFHGSVFGFYSTNSINEDTKSGLFDVKHGVFSNYDAGFGIGGPIIRDELWFYTAYNPIYSQRDVDIPGFGILQDKKLIHSFAAKINWRASDNLNFVFTSTGDPSEHDGVGNDVGIQPDSVTNPDMYLQDINEGGFNFSLTGIYNPEQDFILESSISRVNRYGKFLPATEAGSTEVFYNDNLNRIWEGGPPITRDASRYSTTGKIAGTVFLEDHTLNAGIEYKINDVDFKLDLRRVDRTPFFYQETVFKAFGEVSNQIPSFFIQDTWRVFNQLTINAGIRWENQTVYATDNNVAQKVSVPLQPRAGFVFLIDDKGTQRIFGSFGRFAQEFGIFNSLGNHSDNGYYGEIRYSNDPRPDFSGGDTLVFRQNIIRAEVEGLRGQYQDEFSLGYEILIGWNTRLSVQGLYRTLQEAIDDAYIASENRLQFGNPGRGIFSEWPRPQRDYTALIISIERRLAERFNFLASYVLSRDYGNYEGLYNAFGHSANPNHNFSFNDLNTSRENTTGLLPNDRTHVFKFSGYYSFPFGLVAGISFIAQSGTPLSEYAEAERPYNRIKFLSQRGSVGRTPAIWDLNARLMYDLDFLSSFQTRLILDIFHIASQRQPVDFDQRKYLNYDAEGNPINPNSTFGQAYSYQPLMALRLGLEVSF
jgi:hypothetical protein